MGDVTSQGLLAVIARKNAGGGGAATLSFVEASLVTADATDPATHNHNPDSDAVGIILSIVYPGAARTGGAPTIGGVTATEHSASPLAVSETNSEMWYVIGSYAALANVAISIPNTANRPLSFEVISFAASSGSAALDVSGSDSASPGTTPQPSLTTTADGAFIYARLGSGRADVVDVTETLTLTNEFDQGNWMTSGQYLNQTLLGLENCTWNQVSDDYTALSFGFKPSP